MKALWNGTVLAESEDTVLDDGEHYFPAAAVKAQYLLSSNTRSMCSRRGQAVWYTLFVDGDAKPDAAWSYPEPREGFEALQGRIAFGRGVQVVE